jgi:membrane protein required for colicin V production
MLIIISVIGPWAQQSPTWQHSTLAPALMPYAPLAMQVSKQVAEQAWDQVKTDAKP